MTLNISAASTPAPVGAVNSTGSPNVVNFDKFSAPAGKKRPDTSAVSAAKDSRMAMAIPAVGAGVLLAVAAAVALVAAKYLYDRRALESSPMSDEQLARAYERLTNEKAGEIVDKLQDAKGAADSMGIPMEMPAVDAVKRALTSTYEEAKRSGSNFVQMADRFAKQITGQSGGAGNPPTVSQPPPNARPAPITVPNAVPVQPTRPAAPVAAAATQRQASASEAAIRTLTKANTAAPNAYAAMEKFYQAASGGRAARVAGALNAPLQSVRQAQAQLGSILAAADKQIAGSLPGDRVALGQWRDRVAQGKEAIGKWLTGAVAFSQGRSKPNGPATAHPTMPRLPDMVLEPPGAQGRGSPQSRRLVDQYTQAARQSAAPSPTTAATLTTTPTAPANTDQAALALFKSATAQTVRINTGVQAFYERAAGGAAARSRGALAEPLKQVSEARDGLSKSILAINKQIANSSAQARPAFEAYRSTLRQARDAATAWLPKASAFAAGLSGPNGKRVAWPALPPTPSYLSAPAGQSPKDVAAGWVKARNAAGNALAGAQQAAGAQGPSTVTSQKPSQTAAAPNVKFVDKFSPSVTRVAPVWVNPVTGEASATAKTGKDWVKAQAGLSLAANTSGADKPPNIKWTDGKNTIEFRLPGGGGKGPRLLAAIGAIGSLLFVGSSVLGSADAQIDRREKAWLETANTSFKPFYSPPSYANADAKAQGLVTMWKSYLDQVPGLIEKNRVSDSKSEIAGVQKEFAAHGAEFLQGLANDRDALKNMSDAEKTNLLDTMSKKRLPEFSSTIKGTEQRPTKLMAALTKKLNESVAANSAGEIASRRIAAQKPSSPAPTGGAAAAPDAVAESQASIRRKLGVPPANKIIMPTADPSAPTKPISPRASPTALPPQAVSTAASTVAQAQAAQKKDEAKALDTVATAVKRENLVSPPNLTALGNLRFTLDMFIDKSQRGDSLQLQLAREKADRIFAACVAAEEGSATVGTKVRVQGTASRSLEGVMKQLFKLQTAPPQSAPAIEPSVVPTGADPVPKPTQSLDSNEAPPPVLEPSTAR